MISAILLALVLRLDAPAFRAREAAHSALRRLGPLAERALDWGERNLAPEGRRRCEVLLGPTARARAYRRAGSYPLPWIDSRDNPGADWTPPVVADCDRFLGEAGGRGSSAAGDFPAYREATRLWITSQLLQRRPDEEIRRTLRQLQNDEDAWKKRHAPRLPK